MEQLKTTGELLFRLKSVSPKNLNLLTSSVLVTSSKALVTSSDALVTNSFLFRLKMMFLQMVVGEKDLSFPRLTHQMFARWSTQLLVNFDDKGN